MESGLTSRVNNMDITLFHGTREFTAELNVDQDTGEILSEFPLDILVQRNPIGTAAFILNTIATADMIDVHIKTMQAKKKALTNNAERAKEALKQVMQITGVFRVESLDKTFKAILHKERDKSVEIFNEDMIPSDYMQEIPATYTPDKILIMKSMKEGFEIPGVRIIAKDRLEVK
jgi:predicted small secreted protein